EIERIFSRSSLERIGWRTSRRFVFDVPSRSKMFGRGPMIETRLITSSSRIGSIGGLVTCAKFCLKYVNSDFGLSDKAEIGVSVPIGPTASSPGVALRRLKNFRSAWV